MAAGLCLPHLTTELHSLSTPAVVLLGCGSWCPADPTRICLVIRITRDLLKNLCLGLIADPWQFRTGEGNKEKAFVSLGVCPSIVTKQKNTP